MILQPIENNARRAHTVRGASIPAPTGGWDTEANQAAMKADRAAILDNFIPREMRVEMRRGSLDHATGLTGSVESLMAWNGPGGAKMFAASGETSGSYTVHETTAAGAVSTADISSLNSKRWQWVNFATSAGHYLWMANGADAPMHYDGSAWATPSLTGVTAADILAPVIYKRRIFVIFNDSLDFGYLPADAIAGAVGTFPLGALLTRGGRIVCAGTWTQDGGAGPDDYIVFCSSAGQMVAFSGTDPSSASAWTLIGVYDLAVPLSVRGIIKVGGDLGVITADGVLSLSNAAQMDRAAADRASVSQRIKSVIRTRAKESPGFGWELLSYATGGLLFVNAPQPGDGFVQYVMNVATGAWGRLRGMPARTWLEFGGRLYFGGVGAVVRADTGLHDNGMPIQADMLTAWNPLSQRGTLKQVTMLRSYLTTIGQLGPAIDVKVDFDASPPTSVPTLTGTGAAQWDVDKWNEALWAGEAQSKAWGVSGQMGYLIGIRMRVSSSTATGAVDGFDIQYRQVQRMAGFA